MHLALILCISREVGGRGVSRTLQNLILLASVSTLFPHCRSSLIPWIWITPEKQLELHMVSFETAHGYIWEREKEKNLWTANWVTKLTLNLSLNTYQCHYFYSLLFFCLVLRWIITWNMQMYHFLFEMISLKIWERSDEQNLRVGCPKGKLEFKYSPSPAIANHSSQTNISPYQSTKMLC